MTDPGPLTIGETVGDALFCLELWGDAAAVEARLGWALPSSCRAAAVNEDRLIWWEPNVWLIRTSRSGQSAMLKRLNQGAGTDGVVIELSGAFARLRLEGSSWRELLMIGGVFDAEAASFGPGSAAGTIIHHLPVRLDVIDAWTVDAYTPPSYAPDLLLHWRRADLRMV